MKWQRPALLWTAVLAAGLGLWAGHRLAPAPTAREAMPGASVVAAAPALQVGDSLPALSLPDLEGRPLDLRQHAAGRPLLINVWASWCAPCVEEMPELARFAATQGDNGVQVLGLALDTADGVRGFLQRIPVTIPADTPAGIFSIKVADGKQMQETSSIHQFVPRSLGDLFAPAYAAGAPCTESSRRTPPRPRFRGGIVFP